MQHARAITEFIVREFLPDVPPAGLDPDTDLVADGVIDSLGLLKLLVWLEDEYGINADEVDLAPESLRSVAAIDAFVLGATAGQVEAT